MEIMISCHENNFQILHNEPFAVGANVRIGRPLLTLRLRSRGHGSSDLLSDLWSQ